MITKKLGKITFAWEPSAFRGKGYWFVLGKNGGLGRAASKKEANSLKVPKQEKPKEEQPQKEQEQPQQTAAPTPTATPAPNKDKKQKNALISTKSFNSLTDVRSGDSFGDALGKFYALMKVRMETEKEQEEIDALFTEERNEMEEKNHKELLAAILSLKPAKKSRQQKRAEERKEKKKEVSKEKAEAKKAEEPKKAAEKEKAPEKAAEKPKAEKVEKEVAPKKEVEPPKKAEAVPEKPPTPKETPTAQPAVPKQTGAIPKSTTIAKTIAGGAGVIGTITAGLVAAGITNEYAQRAVISNVGKETGFKPKEEDLASYSKTSNARIREVFTKRVEKYSDAELDQIKKDPVKFGEAVYGKDTEVGKKMGNTEPGDGFKYRGRGAIQLTGKANYKAYSKVAGVDLVNNPDALNDPAIDAKVVAAFVKAGVGKKINDFTDQATANRAVTQAIGGASLNLDKGIGAQLLSKVNQYAEALPSGGSGTQLASASSENKDLKSQSGGGTTIVNNNTSIVAQGGKQETLMTNKVNDKPIMFQG